ncbi:MAG TPA: hypothetical protein VH062_27895 [Polyangiaceae bacterium]|nr:hypothetical protein [Polyangiaceae bacterium]
MDAWCAFLGRLATDAEAALAAALAYKELAGRAREDWIAALEHDLDRVSVPAIAVYAPLLAVETDPKRRERILSALGPVQADATPTTSAFGLASRPSDRARIAVIVAPLYLDFVQVLACAYRPGEGFDWVKHDPIVEQRRAPRAGQFVGGVEVEATPLGTVVDDLAITVVAHTRTGETLPEALSVFADLFGPGGEAPARLTVAP